jgi:hypothetical protein
MTFPPLPPVRIGGEAVENTTHGESYQLTEFSVAATDPRIDKVVAQ